MDMKESYTHAGLAVLVTLIIYSLSFSEAFDEIKHNVLGVIMLFLVMMAIGHFFAEMFYEGKSEEKSYGKKIKV